MEIIISMLILGIVTAGTYGLFVNSHKFIIEAKQRLQAVNQAGTVLEKLRMYVSEDPDHPENAGEALKVKEDPYSPTVIGLGETPDAEALTNPQWDYLVEKVPGTDCSKVTVTVSWEEL